MDTERPDDETDDEPGYGEDDWKHDEDAWADQWDKVQADYEEAQDYVNQTKSDYEQDPDDEDAKRYYKNDLENLKKAKAKHDAFKKVGDKNQWTDEYLDNKDDHN